MIIDELSRSQIENTTSRPGAPECSIFPLFCFEIVIANPLTTENLRISLIFSRLSRILCF